TEGLVIHRIPPVPVYTTQCSGISIGKPVLDVLLMRKLMTVARNGAYDVIHAHNYEAPPAAYAVRRRYGIPVVYHAHNTMFHELPSYFHWRTVQYVARKTGRWMDRIIPGRANAVIAVSEDQQRYLMTQGVPAEKITVIPPCIEPETLAGGDRRRIRQRLGIGDAPVMLYTGGLQPYQNCRILIDVLRHGLRDCPDLHLIILARSAPEWLKDHAHDEGVFDRVYFLQGRGLAFERDCLAAADVGVIPRSHCIGFPVKLLNYLAAGLPVVCFQGVNKGFTDGMDLLAVENGNVPAMADAVNKILTDPDLRRTLIAHGSETLMTHHTWERAVDKITGIYESLARPSAV
ncbi:MAG TPA: glycosyltransferase family 4 protein, partial [bacterium]|nr:glycosyltransferase family 4 protein [bacterium]